MAFKPNMLLPAGGSGTVTAIADPFGNSYGYSTAQASLIQAAIRLQSDLRSLEHGWLNDSPGNRL